VRPLIAINAELEGGEEARKLVLPLRYAAALERAGARPVLVPPVEDERTLDELVRCFDGLCLSGGDDFDTERMGLGPTHPSAKVVPAEKQDFDLRLVRLALERELPILGICYGMQLLGLAGGGRLHQHLPEDRPGKREHRGGVVHDVRIRAGSRLAAIARVERSSVISRHHQAVSAVGPDWLVSATDDEGLIEAIEHRAHPFALGVQWHPELSEEPSDRALLEGFVSAARAWSEGAALSRS
jgi:putative glutamine amidotransferase